MHENALTSPEAAVALKTRLTNIRNALAAGLLERDIEIRLALLCAVAGEHLLLLGPPGTAKSLLARRLRLAFRGAPYFEYLLTRFSVPEEVFGPLSLRALERDEYRRQTDRYLPTAAIAFLDEIFKANSAILNALLTLLNEREFDNGGGRTKTPLISVVGASNELPEPGELDALYDRFLVRVSVVPVSDSGFNALLDLSAEPTTAMAPDAALDEDVLSAIRATARTVRLPEDVKELLRRLRKWAAEQQIAVSDRRWRKITGLLRTAAATEGRAEVSIWDCWLLRYCVGDRPENAAQVGAWYEQCVGATASADPRRVTLVVGGLERALKEDQEQRVQRTGKDGQPLFLDPSGRPMLDRRCQVPQIRDGESIYLAPAELMGDRTKEGKGFTAQELDQLYIRSAGMYFSQWHSRGAYLSNAANRLTKTVDAQPAMEPARFTEAHVRGRLTEVSAALSMTKAYLDRLREQIASVEQVVRNHLWIDPRFAEPASRNLKKIERDVGGLLGRLEAVQSGFESLPRRLSSKDDSDDGEAAKADT